MRDLIIFLGGAFLGALVSCLILSIVVVGGMH